MSATISRFFTSLVTVKPERVAPASEGILAEMVTLSNATGKAALVNSFPLFIAPNSECMIASRVVGWIRCLLSKPPGIVTLLSVTLMLQQQLSVPLTISMTPWKSGP